MPVRTLICLWLLCVCCCGSVLAARPTARVPADVNEVLEQLPRGYAAISPTSASRPPASVEQAIALLRTAAQSGDSRLARRADALLEKFPKDGSSLSLLRARAFSAQHHHDFNKSLRLLDQLIAADPRDPQARFARAQILLVQGRIDLARSECGKLAMSVDADVGMLCAAAVALRTGQYASARRLADRWLAAPGSDVQARRFITVMGAEIAARSGQADEADARFRAALALVPHDVRTLSAYARFMMQSGRSAEVIALLAGAGDNEGLQLLRTLAAAASGHRAAEALRAAQGRRYRLAREAGLPAEIMLTLEHAPDAALALALENFQSQRDFEDVQLLQRAAQAAGKPQALQPMQAWARAQQLQVAPLRNANAR